LDAIDSGVDAVATGASRARADASGAGVTEGPGPGPQHLPLPSSIDLPAVLQGAVEEAAGLLGADAAILYLVDRGADHARWAYDAGIDDERVREWIRGRPPAIGSGMVGMAIASGQVLATEDYATDERFWDAGQRQEMAGSLRLRSIVVAPLLGGHEPLGALCVFDRSTRTFSEPELALVRALAGHAALAVENARLNVDLLAAEARHRFLLEHSPDGIWSVDATGSFTFVSDSMERIVGWRPDELLGRDWEIVHHESSDDEVHRRLDWLTANPGREALFRCSLRHRDGRAVAVETHAIGMVADGRFAGAHGSIRETAQRDRLERGLRGQAAELAASQERARLAQELHDSITQALFSMTLTARSAELLLHRDVEATAEKLGELRELARDALAEMRALIFELRPGSLAEEGLVSALRKHIGAVEGRTGLSVLLDVDDVPRMALDVEDALYRITQEALHNVVKHAGARHVKVSLCCEGGVCLEVSDDGAGFDPAAVTGDHLGLAGIRTRVDRLGGTLTVESSPGAGTRIEVVMAETPPAEGGPAAG
jgi:PAS domain S-box-containing protein